MAGDHTSVFEAWYKKVDPSGSGIIQAGPAAGFLKKSGLNDNILSRVSVELVFLPLFINIFLLFYSGVEKNMED